MFGTSAISSTANAPKYDSPPAEEIVTIDNNTVTSVNNTKGVNLNDPKLILGEMAVKYGVKYDSLYRTVQCESGFQHKGLFGDSGLAYGISQFHKATFEGWNKQRGTTLDYYNLEDQLDMMAWAFKNGYAFHWTCYTSLIP